MKKIFQAIVPGWKGSGLPREFPFHIRFGLRASVIVAHIFSIAHCGLPFGMVSEEKRGKIMEHLYYHRLGVIRNLVQFWKLTAFMTRAEQAESDQRVH